MPNAFLNLFSKASKPFVIGRLDQPSRPRPKLTHLRAASDSHVDYAALHSLDTLARVSARSPVATAAPASPEVVPTVAEASELNAALTLEMQVQNLELIVVREMGPWALHGLRYSTFLAVAAASAVSLVFAVVPMAIPVMPGLGVLIFVGVLVLGISLGAIAQALARRAWRRRSEGPEALLQKVDLLKLNFTRKDSPTGAEIAQLRRLQVLENDIRGGIKQALWSILYACTGLDPALRGMMRHASDRAHRTARPWYTRIPVVGTRPGFWNRTNVYSAGQPRELPLSLAEQMIAAPAILPAPQAPKAPAARPLWRRPTLPTFLRGGAA